MRYLSVFTIFTVAAATSLGHADTVTIPPSKDNTLYQDLSGQLSNGAGFGLFCGRTNQGGNASIRRALVAFDIAGNVPAGSTITGVTLHMYVEQTTSGTQTCGLHRVQQDWGEAGSFADGFGGGGAQAEPGDTTWLHTFYPSSFWSAAGGDFDVTASATASIGGVASTPAWSGGTMVADLQSWLDAPAGNFGWLLRSNESTGGTAKNLDSRETPVPFAPALEITFDPPVAACDGDTNGDDVVDVNDLNNVILDWGTDGSANGGDITGAVPDSPPDGIVDVNDLNAVIVNWGSCP